MTKKSSGGASRARLAYFAHPVSDYGKEREALCLRLIQGAMPGFELLNPNQKAYVEAYAQRGMALFEELVLTCDALVAVAFPGGEWGMGVWREAEVMARKGGKVYELSPEDGTIREVDFRDIRPLSISETRRRVAAGR